MTFVQIGEFDWLSGRQKGLIFIKMFKNLLLRNHIRDEAETWHTFLGHYPLQKLCFLFRSDKNSGYTPRKLCLWEGILFSCLSDRLSVRTSDRVSVTFCFLNILKSP